MQKKDNEGFQLNPPELNQHTATIESLGGKEYTFTELTGLQAVICDTESGLLDDEKKDTPLAWFDFRCFFIAMAMEKASGKSYKELVPIIKQHRAGTIGELYQAARVANGDVEEGGPKDQSA